MRKSYKYASIVAALSVSGLGGAALVLHDRNVQGTISDDVYWKKIASANKNSNALVTDNESVDDLISLADRINAEDSSSILSKNATSLVNKAQKSQNKTNLINPIVEKAVEDTTNSNKEDTQEDKNKTQDTSTDKNDKSDEVIKEGWNSDKTMYYVDGSPITGLYTIEGQEYYFDEKGKIYTGFLDVEDEDGIGETVYYKNGIKCYKRTKIDGDYYYFDSENGYMVIYEWVGDRFYNEDGKEIHGLYTIDDKQYYFYNDGKLAVGSHTETYNGHKIRCYSNDDIEKDDYGVKQYGIIEVNGKTVKLDTVTGGEYDGDWKGNIYYDEDGETLSGKQTVAGRDLYFKDNGEAVFGWYVDSYNNAYYTNPETGIQAFGLVEIIETTDTGENTEDHIYYFDEDTGISITAGWHKGSDMGQLNGKIYFVAQKGKAPYLATGRTEIDGKAYYFGEDSGMLQINMRGNYFTDENGVIQTGEQEVDGKKVFYDDNGELVNGWYTKDGKTYYYGTNGKAKGEVTIDGVKFEFDEETGELLSKGFIDGLYINDDGSIFYGLKEIDGNTYYFDVNKGGKYATGTVIIPKEYSVSGKTTTQYFDENGHQVLGFVTINGSTYWFDKTQGRVTNTIITTNGNKYYFAEDGRLFKNGTRKIDNNSKKITSDENGVVTKIESMGIENPMLPANDSFEWHAASEYETHSGNPFTSPWCTWWAWNRFYEIYGYSPGTHGNGCTNADELLAAHPDKFQKSDTLVAGAMFSVQPFGTGASATAGHVGIIEKVDGDYVYTSEGGYTSNGGMGVGLKKYTKAEFYATYSSVTIAAPINN